MDKPSDPREFFKGSQFIKAAASGGGGSGGDICVEVTKREGFVGVRDSKNPDGPVLAYTEQEWRVFIDAARNGEFDF